MQISIVNCVNSCYYAVIQKKRNRELMKLSGYIEEQVKPVIHMKKNFYWNEMHDEKGGKKA